MSKEVIKTTWPDVANNTVEKLGDIGSFVKEIADNLNEKAPQVWNGLVEYHRWLAITDLAVSVLIIIWTILFIIFSVKTIKKTNEIENQREIEFYKNRSQYNYENLEWKALSFVKVVILIVSSIIFCCASIIQISKLPNITANVIVPERAAALEIINLIKSP